MFISERVDSHLLSNQPVQALQYLNPVSRAETFFRTGSPWQEIEKCYGDPSKVELIQYLISVTHRKESQMLYQL